MRYHLTSVRWPSLKKSTNNKSWRRRGEKDTSTLLVGMEMVQILWRTVWRFLKKLKIELPYDPAIPFLGIYLEKTLIWKDTCTPVLTAALIIIVKIWKQSKCPSTNEWGKKSWYTQARVCTGILFSHKKWNAICSN